MAALVVDASVALSWFFEDEALTWTDSVLDGLAHGDRIGVPAHWPTEVSNGLLTALRRQRIPSGRAEAIWDEIALLPIDIEPPLSAPLAKAVLALARQLERTVYDAAYRELAIRKGWPLATPDAALSLAAARSRVQLIAG